MTDNRVNSGTGRTVEHSLGAGDSAFSSRRLASDLPTLRFILDMKVLLSMDLGRNSDYPAKFDAGFSRDCNTFSKQCAGNIGHRTTSQHLGLDFQGASPFDRTLELRIDCNTIRAAGRGAQRERLTLSPQDLRQMPDIDVLEHIAGDGIHTMPPAGRVNHVDHASLLLVPHRTFTVQVVENKRDLGRK